MPLIDLDQANAFETAALPGTGDSDAGAGGLTTSSMTNETDLESYGLDAYGAASRRGGAAGDGSGVSSDYAPPDGARHAIPHMASDLAGSPVDHPFWTIALIGAGLLAYKAIVKNESTENIKISIPTAIAVTGMATIGILVEKWVFGLWQLPSITPTMDFL